MDEPQSNGEPEPDLTQPNVSVDIPAGAVLSFGNPPAVQTTPPLEEEAPRVATIVQTGLVSTPLAGGVERLEGGAFGPTSKGYIVLILEYVERELQRRSNRLEDFEQRERELLNALGEQRTNTAVLTLQRDDARQNQRTQNLLRTLAGALLGVGLGGVAAIVQSFSAGTAVTASSVILAILGLIVGVVLLIAVWKM